MLKIGVTRLEILGHSEPLSPVIGLSIDFLLSLLPPEVEKILVNHFEGLLVNRSLDNDVQKLWMCKEGGGPAFLIGN